MATQRTTAGGADAATVIDTADRSELKLVIEENVQAVIFTPPALPGWFDEVAHSVETGDFQIARTVLPNANYQEIERTLELRISTGVLSAEVRECLKQDMMALVDDLRGIYGVSRFMLRCFTEAPTHDCGYHVDTVPPAAPTCGLLRVYNGQGTESVSYTHLTLPTNREV